MFAPKDLTRDAFLGGRVQAWQPRAGYRAGSDPVFLAAACAASPGDTVLELGCGAGVASLCLAARVPGVVITGVERQAAYADLARQNGLDVVEADLTNLPRSLRSRSFAHVIANPPYFSQGGGTAAADAGREAAQREETPLTGWIDAARRRLAPKGWLTLILSADRTPEALAAMAGFGAVRLLPLAARQGRPAGRVLIRGRKGARGGFSLLAPFVLHEGPEHARDGNDFSEAAERILRHAEAIGWNPPGKSPQI